MFGVSKGINKLSKHDVKHSVSLSLSMQAKLDEAVSLATGFQTSLQDTINWLTQAEQTLNMAQPPSLILDTVLFQIDEHKVGEDGLLKIRIWI